MEQVTSLWLRSIHVNNLFIFRVSFCSQDCQFSREFILRLLDSNEKLQILKIFLFHFLRRNFSPENPHNTKFWLREIPRNPLKFSPVSSQLRLTFLARESLKKALNSHIKSNATIMSKRRQRIKNWIPKMARNKFSLQFHDKPPADERGEELGVKSRRRNMKIIAAWIMGFSWSGERDENSAMRNCKRTLRWDLRHDKQLESWRQHGMLWACPNLAEVFDDVKTTICQF